MKRRAFFLTLLSVAMLASLVWAGAPAREGERVWAQWRPNAWYPGQTARPVDIGWHIDFDDGDRADVPRSLVVPDSLPFAAQVGVGTRVLARWTNERFYPGTVAGVDGNGAYAIQFDDGDRRTVGIDELRLLPGARQVSSLRIGERVWAQWRPNAWYSGRVAARTAVGRQVAFDDGDSADLPRALIVRDRAPRAGEVRVGTRVLALWTDGRPYPGTVAQITAGGEYYIQFDDSDRRTVSLSELRLLGE